MKVSPTLATIVGACLLFLFSSWVPDGILNLLAGTKVGAGALLIAVLVVLRRDQVLGIAVFLAAAALFLEHRRRLVQKVQVSMAVNTAVSAPAPVAVEMEPAAPLVKGEEHPSFDTPTAEEHPFEPEEGSGSNAFSRAGQSIDEKHPLETASPFSEEIGSFYEQKGLAAPFEASNSA